MFTGLGARGVSPNPFSLGIICRGPAEQVSTRGYTYADNVRFAMLIMTRVYCVMRRSRVKWIRELNGLLRLGFKGMLEFITDRDIYEKVICGRIGKAHKFVWIATSDLKDLHVKKVIVPVYPGAFSALGMLIADARFDYMQTSIMPSTNLDFEKVDEIYRRLEARAREDLKFIIPTLTRGQIWN